MSTIEATMSMLEVMPEDARIKVLEFTQQLFTSKKPENPFLPLTADMIMEDIEKSEEDIKEGNYRPMEEALDDMERKYFNE